MPAHAARAIVVVMTDTAPELFDRLADRYNQVIPFFAEFAGQLLDVLGPDPGTRLPPDRCRSRDSGINTPTG